MDYFDTGTPLSSNYYMGVQKGEAYGLDHTTERYHSDTASRLRPVTEIPGLYLTGMYVNLRLQDIIYGCIVLKPHNIFQFLILSAVFKIYISMLLLFLIFGSD